ncbi:hypothetical protein AB0436_06395 [Streptomyces sp. NPDC051322]|uniref:hypothetical protein n=1 Tax=Streptomyces sp. NPDC051322 TaxID=3154645 RepID=UPI00345006CE
MGDRPWWGGAAPAGSAHRRTDGDSLQAGCAPVQMVEDESPRGRGRLTGRPRAVLHALWDNLPALAAVNLVVCLALLPAAACAAAGRWKAVPLVALVPGTTAAAGAVATATRVLSPDPLRLRGWAAAMWRAAPLGAGTGLVGGIALTAVEYDVHAYRTSEATWPLLGLLPAGAVLALLVVAGGHLLVLATAYGVRGRRLWYAALCCAARTPAATLASLMLVGVSALVLVVLGPGLLFLLPGPIALLSCAVTLPAIQSVLREDTQDGG